MTKQDLIDNITEEMKIQHNRAVNKTDVAALLESLGTVSTRVLQADGEVTLPGLGKLTVKAKDARTGRNPKTGEAIQIPAKRKAGFTPAKALKDALI